MYIKLVMLALCVNIARLPCPVIQLNTNPGVAVKVLEMCN